MKAYLSMSLSIVSACVFIFTSLYIFSIFPLPSMINVILLGTINPLAPKLLATDFFESERKSNGRLYLSLKSLKALGLS